MAIVAQGVRFVKPGEFTGESSEVVPAWINFVEVIGLKGLPQGGGWVNCAYSYRKPSGKFYALEAAVQINEFLERTGVCYVRCCTCPDYGKRRGPARQQSRQRFCKHMKALQIVLIQAAGQSAPDVASLPLGVFAKNARTRAALGMAQAAKEAQNKAQEVKA
jgi:hypothetical protein